MTFDLEAEVRRANWMYFRVTAESTGSLRIIPPMEWPEPQIPAFLLKSEQPADTRMVDFS